MALKLLMRASLFGLFTCFVFALCAEEEAKTAVPPAQVAEQVAEQMALPQNNGDTVASDVEQSLVKAEPPATISSPPPVAAFSQPSAPEGYTINYNTISILEYVRFASKICNVNFIFNNADLDFNVTVVSDAPITPENVMSTLLQVLRMHGLELLEQDNNLVIHKAADVRQIATLVTENGQGGKAAIVTRIFRIKNAKVDSIAAIIRPMVSTAALLETAIDTRQLILTDVRTNVDKVAALIEILDSPSMPLEIKSYEGSHNNPLSHLVEITQQMMAPMSHGNPFVMVPNDIANAIYIVSTPELVERAIAILQVVDVPAKPSFLQDRKLKSENVFISRPQYRGGNDLLKALNDVATNLKNAGLSEGDLIPTIEMARWISESNSIMFVGTKESLEKVKELLSSLDRPLRAPGEETSFFIYRPQNRTSKELLNAIHEMAQNLKDSKITDKELLLTLSSARLNENANSLTFSGEEKTFPGVRELLSMIDVKGTIKYSKSSFLLYKVQNTSPQLIESSLKSFANTLDKSKATDENLVESIHSMQLIGDTNSILFVGSELVLKRLQDILPSFDTSQEGMQNQFFIYKPNTVRGDQLAASLKELTEDLHSSQFSDPSLLRTLQSVKYVKTTNSFLFTGDAPSIKKLEDLIASVDNPQALKDKNFILYEPKSATKESVEFYLKQLSDNLSKKGGNEELLSVIRSMKWVDISHSFMFYGSESALNQLNGLLERFDANQAEMTPSNFFMYKPQHISSARTLKALLDIAESLKKSQLSDPNLIQGIETANAIETTNSIVFTGSNDTLQKIQELLKEIDSVSAGQLTPYSGYYLYKIQNAPADQILKDLNKLADNFVSSGLKELKIVDVVHNIRYVKETNALLITGDPKAIEETKQLIAQYDSPDFLQKSASNFFMYKPEYISIEQLQKSLQDLTNNLKQNNLADPFLLKAIESAKLVASTGSIVFTGSPETIQKVQAVLKDIDVISAAKKSGYFIYKIQNTTGDVLKQDLETFSKDFTSSGFKDTKILDVIRNMRYIKDTNSILLTGDTQTIDEVKALLAEYDYPRASAPKLASNFLMYKPVHVSPIELQKALRDVSDNMKKAALSDPNLITTIETAKFVESTRSVLFTGSPDTLEKVQSILQEIDAPLDGSSSGKSGFFLYNVQNTTGDQLKSELENLTKNFATSGLKDSKVIEVIRNMRYVKETNSLLLTGDSKAIEETKSLLSQYDVASAGSKPGYYIYKVQNTTGDIIEDDLDSLAKNFASSGLKDVKILDVIRNIRYVKETNSLLLTGDTKAIEETKQLIAEYDYPRAATKKSSNFFMYKPQHVSAAQLQKSLSDIAENLKKADLADPNLLQAIATAKYVETTNSIIFTGTPDTIQKIQSLLQDVDVPSSSHAPIQHVGQTTFLLYKLKYASGSQIVASLQNMLSDLKQSHASDKTFLSALASMKYVKETNSLLFTGDEDALKRVEALVEKFDVTNLAAKAPTKIVSSGPTEYFLYKPQSIPGPEIEQYLKDFEENLKMSSHNDPDLYNVIDSMRWIEKTQNLMFTGTPKALDKIKELLKAFDIPSNLPTSTPSGEPSIQAIDNTSFLVYKLQFHKGDEIQGALRQIAKDLINSNAPVNQNLLNSINSIQWLEVTNSLLCSGDQETLTRLKELIKNLDIPLKQVFIEVLVIETTLSNALTFGLEWGSNFNFRNKYSATMSNSVAPGTTFDSNLFKLTPPTTPTPQLFGTPTGQFDFGVIGEVIKHNGQTYLTLGSLLTALQTDGETTIVMTPKILAQDGRTSTLFQGQNIPFTGSFVQNTSQGATVQTTNIEYRNIGMNLTVTPVLGNSDIVTLDISFDQSQVITSTGNIVISGNNVSSGLTTSQTTMQTTVHVPDKHFLILSGNVNNSNVKSKSGIPCLGGLPLIGAAFSSTSDTITNSNIVVFLRPHILTSIDDMKQISGTQEEFFRDQAGTPFLQYNFDEAMDYVKSVEDE